MPSSKQIVALLVAVTIAATLFVPVFDIVGQNTGTVSVANESVVANVGEPVDLDGYDVDETSVVVTSDGSTVATSDYSVDAGPGTITFADGGNVTDGETVEVSYAYAATSGTTSTLTGLIPLFMALLILGILASKITDGL